MLPSKPNAFAHHSYTYSYSLIYRKIIHHSYTHSYSLRYIERNPLFKARRNHSHPKEKLITGSTNTLYFSLEYRYEFKLLYPENGNIYNIWSQDCNPVIETCAGNGDFVYTPIEIGLPSIGSGGFAGLLTSGSYTYLDGNPTGNWWYAVRNLLSLSIFFLSPCLTSHIHTGRCKLSKLWW